MQSADGNPERSGLPGLPPLYCLAVLLALQGCAGSRTRDAPQGVTPARVVAAATAVGFRLDVVRG